ncbi:MAG: hypothetical protein IE926_15330, partial [Micrococcales bacterium]|nr:hypothetical protein [Micrococcales bacterium]
RTAQVEEARSAVVKGIRALEDAGEIVISRAGGVPGVTALEPLRGDAGAFGTADRRELAPEGGRAQLVRAAQQHGHAPGVTG